MKNETSTFWGFLKDHTVEIPIIQRDYAQGRAGKEELRKKFLTDLKNVLDSKNESGETIKLDFIYGATDSGVMTPLDGQQRLTTLWLLHWFVAFQAKRIDDETKKVLSNFTYETRISSRMFCEMLSGFMTPQPNGITISRHIQNQTWFRASWKNDPTIQSMLRMLGGTGVDDGIECVFKDCSDWNRIWEKLTNDNCPIEFYYLDLYGIRQSDDLYIKMNARGKPLTNFENFKADLAGYIRKKKEVEEKNPLSEQHPWLDLDNEEQGLAIAIDTDWMNVFWEHRSNDYALDEIYFAFLNRYFFNAYALQLNNVAQLTLGVDKIFDHLYGRNSTTESNDGRIAYLGFDEVYKKLFEGNQDVLFNLKESLDNYQKFHSGQYRGIKIKPSWDEDNTGFMFIPQYDEHDQGGNVDFAGNPIRTIKNITQPQRVVFHSICCFFKRGWNEGETDADALKEWIRVVWNIVENSKIDNIQAMIGCLKLIDELSMYSHSILEKLSEGAASIKSNFADDQVKEEVIKARKIKDHSEGSSWKKYIEEAEALACLKGKVLVLFQDGENTTLSTFKERLDLLKNIVEEAKKTPYYLQKVLLSRYEAKLPQTIIDLTNTDSGKKILLTETLCDCFKRVKENSIPSNSLLWVNDLTLTQLLSYSRGKAVSSDGNVAVLWGTNGHKWRSFGNDVRGNVILGNQRTLLLTTKGIEVLNGERVANTNFLCGKNVFFKFNEHWFQWWGIPNDTEFDVYLLKKDWHNNEESPWEEHDEDNTKLGDQQTLYCFKVFAGENEDSFIEKLNELISLSHQ